MGSINIGLTGPDFTINKKSQNIFAGGNSSSSKLKQKPVVKMGSYAQSGSKNTQKQVLGAKIMNNNVNTYHGGQNHSDSLSNKSSHYIIYIN